MPDDQFDGRCPFCRGRDFNLLPVYWWDAETKQWQEAPGWPPPARCCRCSATLDVHDDGTLGVVRRTGPVTFIRGRTSFVLTDGEAKRLYEANEQA